MGFVREPRGGWGRDHAGDVARGRESHLSAFLRRHCAPIYIDTERDREKVREGGGRGSERKGERRGALLPYWHIAADPPTFFFGLFILSFFFLPSPHATRTAVQLFTVHRIHAVAAGFPFSLRAANFARFRATVSHDTVVVNFQLTHR